MGLLQRSMAGAVLIAAVIVIRALTVKRLPKAAFKALWMVAAARLLLPFSVPSRFSLYSLAGKFAFGAGWLAGNLSEKGADTGIGQSGAGVLADGFVAGHFRPDGFEGGIPAGAAGGDWFVSVVEACYLVGIVLLAVVILVSYRKSWQKFRVSLPANHPAVDNWMEETVKASRLYGIRRWLPGRKTCARINVRVSDQITAPLTYGVLRPVILLPKKMDWEDGATLRHVLNHEYMHILHFDAFHKIVLAAILCIHWFNPMVWAMYFLANRDMELYCDEAVVRMGGESVKESYALALIRMEEVRKISFSMYSHFSGSAMEERIRAIMKMKKNSVMGAAFAAALVVGTATLFATSAFAGEQEGTDADGTELKWFDEGRLQILDQEKEGQPGFGGITVSPTPLPEGQPLSDEQVRKANEYILGGNGNLTSKPDMGNGVSGDGITSVSPTPLPGMQDKDAQYKFTSEGQNTEEAASEYPQTQDSLYKDIPAPKEFEDEMSGHTFTQEELDQIIADIESGKIKGYKAVYIDAASGEGMDSNYSHVELVDGDGNVVYGYPILPSGAPEEVESEWDYYLATPDRADS